MNPIDIVTEYLLANYYDDIERMANIKLIQLITTDKTLTPEKAANLVDKVARFNKIEKTYQPTDVDIHIAAREFVKGLNFIMYKGENNDRQ